MIGVSPDTLRNLEKKKKLIPLRTEGNQEMIEDIMNIIHVFSCRMNGKRSHINKKIIEILKNS